MLAFLDLETCGLDVEHDDVLEVACIVTDDRLAEEVARYHAVVRTEREFYELPEVVRDMHTKSGLWTEVKAIRRFRSARPTAGLLTSCESTPSRSNRITGAPPWYVHSSPVTASTSIGVSCVAVYAAPRQSCITASSMSRASTNSWNIGIEDRFPNNVIRCDGHNFDRVRERLTAIRATAGD